MTITARNQNGNPLPNLSLRAEIFVNKERVDFGSLSARNLVTDAKGEAKLVFTAPASPSGPSVDNFTVVQIVVTPVGTDFGNTTARQALIRLVPPGVVVPPDGLQPNFTFRAHIAGRSRGSVLPVHECGAAQQPDRELFVGLR